MRNYRFGTLLSEGLLSVARRWGKTKAGVEGDIYEQMLAQNVPLKETTIRGWCRGFVPRPPELVAWLVQYCITHGRVDRSWADSLLAQAAYPEREALLARLFTTSTDPTSAPTQATATAATNVSSTAVEDPLLPVLSAPRRQLIGRETCLHTLQASLQERIALLALYGLPGVGKTTVAVALAQERVVRERFPAGVLWAGLGRTPDLSSVLSRWATLLDLPTETFAGRSPAEIAQALRLSIGQRSILFIIDDVWKAEDAHLCMVGGPRCSHLITTRSPEIALTLADAQAVVHISELCEQDAIRVLAQFAPVVVQTEPAEARALVRAAGCLPLALSLLGGYLQKEVYSGQPRRLRTALDVLNRQSERLRLQQVKKPFLSPEQSFNAASLSLASSIEASYQVLSPRLRSALLALAAFPAKPNTFSEDAATEVIAGSPRLLDALLDAGMLESSGAGRYSLHQTIVDFAHCKRASQQARTRFLSYFVHFCERFATHYPALDQEVENIQAALQYAISHELHAEVVRVVIAFTPFLLARGLFEQALKLLTYTSTISRQMQNEQGQMKILYYLGQVLERLGQYKQAAATLQEGLALARQDKDQSLLVSFLDTLGYVAIHQGNYQQAEVYLQEGLVLAREREDIPNIGSILRYLGNLAGNRGDLDQAERYYQQALEFAHLGKRDDLRYRLLMGLGILAAERGAYPQAEQYLRQSLQLARERGVRQSICVISSNLGELLILMQRYGEAQACLEEGLALARQINHRQFICNLLHACSLLHLKQAAYEPAASTIQESLDLARDLQNPRLVSISLNLKGDLLFCTEHLPEAQKIYSEALEIARANRDRQRQARALFGLGRVAAASSHYSLAHSYGQQSLALLTQIGHSDQTEVATWLTSLPQFASENKR